MHFGQYQSISEGGMTRNQPYERIRKDDERVESKSVSPNRTFTPFSKTALD